MDYDKLIDMGVELGFQLMSSGAEIYRVEESVNRLLTAYGVAPQVFALPNCLFVSVATPEGHPITRMRRIPAHGTDIELLERCNDLCRRLCRDVPPLDSAYGLVYELRDKIRTFPPRITLLGYVLTSAFFALFFQGTWRDGLCAALCGFAVGWCLLFGQRITGTNAFFRTAVCSTVLSTLAFLLVQLGLGDHLERITIGTLMVLVPGMALTYAMREIMAGDIFSGLHRTAEVILIATAIALGTAVPLVLIRLL
jgi:uncharacterized membrane protein YjjP (DUF1212 family)